MAKEILAGSEAAKAAGATGAGLPATTDAAQTSAAPHTIPPVVVELRQFRKLPVLIKAFQWFPELGEVGGVVLKDSPEPGADRVYVVETLEGDHLVTPADWIITGVKGEKYPCKDDIFRMTYEEAREEELPDPSKLPTTCPRNITWVIVRFSNGDSFKIPAKYIARKMVEATTTSYEDAMRSPKALVEFASNRINWNELTMVSQGYQAPVASDRPVEWATAFKTVEIEPEPKPEKVSAAPKQPADVIKSAKQEDAEEAAKPKEERDDDPDSWKD